MGDLRMANEKKRFAAPMKKTMTRGRGKKGFQKRDSRTMNIMRGHMHSPPKQNLSARM